jgi:hypothetical protein
MPKNSKKMGFYKGCHEEMPPSAAEVFYMNQLHVPEVK